MSNEAEELKKIVKVINAGFLSIISLFFLGMYILEKMTYIETLILSIVTIFCYFIVRI